MIVEREGISDQFFETLVLVVEVLAKFCVEGPTLKDSIISPEILMCGNKSKDIVFVRSQGLDVDYENNPAPKKILLVIVTTVQFKLGDRMNQTTTRSSYQSTAHRKIKLECLIIWN